MPLISILLKPRDYRGFLFLTYSFLVIYPLGVIIFFANYSEKVIQFRQTCPSDEGQKTSLLLITLSGLSFNFIYPLCSPSIFIILKELIFWIIFRPDMPMTITSADWENTHPVPSVLPEVYL